MRLPIFGFGIRRQRIAAAQEQVAALQAARQALILQIKSQIALDYGVAQAADKTLVNARRAAHDAQRVYVMTRKGYFAGALNALNLAQAEGSWVRARLRLANAEVAVHLTQAQLDLDIGQYPTANTGIAPA
jgi:outer membrane protein